jgi:von Willebrand factor type A domain
VKQRFLTSIFYLLSIVFLYSISFATPTSAPKVKACKNCKKIPDITNHAKETCGEQFAMVFLVDKSGSTKEKKLDLFKSLIQEFINKMPEGNELAVIGFDKIPFVVHRLKKLMNLDREAVLHRTSLLLASGQTDFSPAIEEARSQLLKTSAKCKFVIIFTDGVINAASDFALSVVKELKMNGINVSIALFQSADDKYSDLHEIIATNGAGFFIRTGNEEYFRKNVLREIEKLTRKN